MQAIPQKSASTSKLSRGHQSNDNLRKSLPTAAQSHRPSTWPIFLFHFVLPMSILAIVSNNSHEICHDIIASLFATFTYETPADSLKSTALNNKNSFHSDNASPSPLPSSQSSHTLYHNEVDAAIERKKNQKFQSQTTSTKNQNRKKQRQKNQKASRPTGPLSSPMYQHMEANILQLRRQYHASKDTKDEILQAIRFADYLKYRDTTIHDGGTHQTEAIEVYKQALKLLERQWREEITSGVDTKMTKAEWNEYDSKEYDNGSYKGLNRELLLNYESKSTEGLMCSVYTSLGKVFFLSNMFERAVQSYEKCLSHDANYLDALTYRGQVNIILGRFEEAGRDYIQVLKLDTNRFFADSITGLSKVLSANENAVHGGWDTLVNVLIEELPRQEKAYENAKTSKNAEGMKHYADSLKRFHHAMFQYHDIKTNDVSHAWDHLLKGNKYKMSTVEPFDAAQEKQRVRAIKQVFVSDFFPKGIGSQTRTPIFIIGFVRSGSTLLERILDAHPLIVGTGEDSVFNGRLDYIRNEIVKASTAGDLSTLQVTVKKLADDVVIDMIERWEKIDANSRLADPSNDDESDTKESQKKIRPTHFADKMLTNYMNVGFIHLLFPNALILHVVREPMDTIFSAFKHDFPPGGLDYTSDFKGLAQLYHSYRDVMDHWDEVLPGRVTHIRYEDIVTDLRGVAPKIIEAAGVPWDPTVLEFHKKKHAVNTLSTTQVRKGVYSHHLKSWKRYEEFLGPLLQLVGRRSKYDLKTSFRENVH